MFEKTQKIMLTMHIREGFKYYFVDFVRKGGEGGTPHIKFIIIIICESLKIDRRVLAWQVLRAGV